MSLVGTKVGGIGPKPLHELNALEAQDWLRERVTSLREHPCSCDAELAREALLVARNVRAPREVEFLEALISSFSTTA